MEENKTVQVEEKVQDKGLSQIQANEKRSWSEPENYGTYDTSACPAYGQFDVIPIEADIDHLSKYDYLIFLGWNTMTEENMKKRRI